MRTLVLPGDSLVPLTPKDDWEAIKALSHQQIRQWLGIKKAECYQGVDNRTCES
jgi:hypothetical protein